MSEVYIVEIHFGRDHWIDSVYLDKNASIKRANYIDEEAKLDESKRTSSIVVREVLES